MFGGGGGGGVCVCERERARSRERASERVSLIGVLRRFQQAFIPITHEKR